MNSPRLLQDFSTKEEEKEESSNSRKMGVDVLATLQSIEECPERRINLLDPTVGNLNELEERMMIVFHRFLPINYGIEISLSEGEIRLDSDEKFQKILKTTKDIIRMNVNVVKKPVALPRQLSLRPELICDGCGSTEITEPFKCVHCYNVRLCKSCEAVGQHDEHLLIPCTVFAASK